VASEGAAIALFAGIDGGQSSTLAAIGDERGLIARGSGPPADLVGEPRDSSRQADAIRAALHAAFAAAALPAQTRVRALVAGISGFDDGHSAPPRLADVAERTQVVHDTVIAHAGALDGQPGIVVIAGTGSVALGNAVPGGPLVRAGGWGYFFGDEGSAVWLAARAIGAAMRAEDRGEHTALRDRAFAFYGTTSLRAIQHAFAHGEIGRAALAAFAPDVLACAAAGDPAAREIRRLGAQALAGLAGAADRRLCRDEPPGTAPRRVVAKVGGLFRDADYGRAFADGLEGEAQGRLTAIAPRMDPAEGALSLARALAAA
jgi:N-acetylglucosamine kinase-like BadF-type ATPase